MTMFIKIVNGNPEGYPVVEENIRYLFPNVTFPKIFAPEDVEPYGFGMYEFSQIPEVPRFHKVIEGTPTRNSNGIWYQTWNIVEMTDDEKTSATTERENMIRSERFFKLSITDWTVLSDVILTDDKKLAFSTYRQQLRDITNQPGFPWDVIWPTPPS